MTETERESIRANLFAAAHAAVEPWEKFPWHFRGQACDTWQPNSSQALAIDYFGTLKETDQASRDLVLSRIAADIGLPSAGPWQIELEWQDPVNLLGEQASRKTQVDAMASSPRAIICFEAKFGERDGGCCSQPTPTKRGIIQCDGTYRTQVNPENGKSDRCALSAKGIRYWQVIPQVMRLDASSDHTPCPFSGPWYQWMRNVVLAFEVARTQGKVAAVVIAYANHPGLPFPRVLESIGWSSFLSQLREDRVILRTRTYQDLLDLALIPEAPSIETLTKLRAWMIRKIDTVGAKTLIRR